MTSPRLGRSTARHAVLALLVLGAASFGPPPARAQTPPALDVRVPSPAAGGGSLAVRITHPHPSRGPRYPFGAPVMVFVPGALGVGSLAGGATYAQEGFVALHFLFPGGVQGAFHSDGAYDYRGPNCIRALRDVLEFAAGRRPDDLGRTLQAILPVVPLVDHVALFGSSNGGPISMAVLGTYGTELPFVTVYVGWENPTNGQTVAVEVGGKGGDCDPNVDGDGNGVPNDDGKNPYVTSFGDSSIGVDWSRLRYDPTWVTTFTDPAGHPPTQEPGALFLDGNGNDRIDTVPGSNPACFDLNGNGRLDAGDDYVFRPYLSWDTGVPLFQHSPEATQEAWNRGVTGGTWPASYAEPAECEAFWSLRESRRFYAAIRSTRPDLHCLLAFSASDHVQADDGHAHIQQAYDNLRAGGIWCRLNCDDSYYRALVPNPSQPPMDADANVAVAYPDLGSYDEPYGLSSTVASLAGLGEMLDREMTRNWSANLEGVVTDVGSPDFASARPRALAIHVTPNPATSSTRVLWEAPGTGGALRWRLFDAAGRRRAALDEPSQADATRGSLDVSRLFDRCPGCAPGVYWLRLEAGSDRAIARVLHLAR